MSRCQVSFGLVLVLLLAQAASAVEVPGWSDIEPGVWRVLRYSERWGDNPAFEQEVRQTLTGFDADGRPHFEVETLRGDEGDAAIEVGRQTSAPEEWGLELRGGPVPTTVDLLGRTISAVIKTYEGRDAATGQTVRVTVIESDQVRLFPRALSQWQTDAGFTLGPHVVRAVSERVDADGLSLSIEQELVGTGVPIEVEGKTVACVVMRSRSYDQRRGDPKGEPRGEITRWLSPEVPGHMVRMVQDNMAGRIRTTELVAFGTPETPAPTPATAVSSAESVAPPPGTALAPVEVDDLQDALKRRWEGRWVVARVELHSACDGTFTPNEVEGRRVQGGARARFQPGEIAKVENVDVRRSRVDLRLALVEPLLVERREGPFELYEELRCQAELRIQVDRQTVKEDLMRDAEASLSAVLERHDRLGDASASALWNGRKRRDLPADYQETLATYRTWRREQNNREIRVRVEGATDRAASYLDHLVRDPQAASTFAAGVASVRGQLPSDCNQLMRLDVTQLPTRSVGGPRADEAYAAGQRLAYYLELAQRLGDCLVDGE